MAPVAISKLIAIRTAVYVDGFNLYYWLKPTPFRWINIERLVLNALAYKSFHHQLVAIKYFTAEVSDTASDPGKHRRQRKRMPQSRDDGRWDRYLPRHPIECLIL